MFYLYALVSVQVELLLANSLININVLVFGIFKFCFRMTVPYHEMAAELAQASFKPPALNSAQKQLNLPSAASAARQLNTDLWSHHSTGRRFLCLINSGVVTVVVQNSSNISIQNLNSKASIPEHNASAGKVDIQGFLSSHPLILGTLLFTSMSRGSGLIQ
jgi:hypothetical protein